MANIGSLTVSLAARTDKFVKGLGSARLSLNKFVAAASKMAVGAAIGAVAAGMAALGLATRNAFREMDAVGKQADRIGIMTESLVSLRRASKRAGASQQELDSALERMNRTTGMAIQRNGAAIRAFENLGISIDQLIHMPTERRIGAISDALSNIEHPALRAAAAADIFGMRSRNVINLLMQGSGALDDARRRADQLGITFNRIEARKIEMANDAWDEMSIALQGVGNQIALVLSPLFAKLGEIGVNSLMSINGEASRFEKIMDVTVNVIISVMAMVQNVVNVIIYTLTSLGSFIITLGGFISVAVHKLIDGVLKGIVWAGEKIVGVISNIPGPFSVASKGALESIKELSKGIEREAKIQEKIFMLVSLGSIETFKKTADSWGRIFSGKTGGELRDAWDKMNADFESRAGKSSGNVKNMFEDLIPDIEKIERSITQRAGTLEAGADISIAAMAMSGAGSIDRDQLAEQKQQTKLQEQMLAALRGPQTAMVGA
jgi:hypothetical protein